MYWANLFNASCQHADFTNARLTGADLTECDFTEAVLCGANLGRDNLGGSTQVPGANFTGADLIAVVWDGAEFDDTTVFPSGFDPLTKGMQRKSV